MTDIIDRLSREETDFSVDGAQRGDEIGVMARALDISKENTIKKLEMEAKERQEIAIREERARKMEELTNHFDVKVSEMIEIVAAATAEMRTTAENMSGNAEQTNMQARITSYNVCYTKLLRYARHFRKRRLLLHS